MFPVGFTEGEPSYEREEQTSEFILVMKVAGEHSFSISLSPALAICYISLTLKLCKYLRSLKYDLVGCKSFQLPYKVSQGSREVMVTLGTADICLPRGVIALKSCGTLHCLCGVCSISIY